MRRSRDSNPMTDAQSRLSALSRAERRTSARASLALTSALIMVSNLSSSFRAVLILINFSLIKAGVPQSLPPSRSSAAITGTYNPPNFFLNVGLLSRFSMNFVAREGSIRIHSIAAGRTLLLLRAVQSGQSCSVELLRKFGISTM